MERIIIDTHLCGRNVFDAIRRARPGIRPSELYKAFSRRDVKVNGIRVGKDFRPQEGDVILVYIRDELAAGNTIPDIRRIYEDDNILVVFKPAGMPACPLSDQIKELSLQAYLESEYGNMSLCHRIDRNTEGLLIAARSVVVLEEIKRLLNSNHIGKYYTALVHGRVSKEYEMLEAYLFKDARKSFSSISSEYKKGSRRIRTEYRLIGYMGENSLLEVRILTGRTESAESFV